MYLNQYLIIFERSVQVMLTNKEEKQVTEEMIGMSLDNHIDFTIIKE